MNQGLVRPCISTAILQEYAEVLARPKFGFPHEAIAALIAMLCAQGELIEAPDDATDLPDLDDAKFVQCAAAAEAAYLVTGNKRHFPDACGAARIVNAAELLDWITLEL